MKRAIIALFLVLLALRVLAAARLELFGDEAFYWMCGQRLAPAYADHPFLTALLVRGGTELLGDTTLGVRLLFLLCGALLPFAVYALARPVVGARDAWLAAGASLTLPVLAVMGAVAVPDAPLLLLAAGTALGLERAARTGRTSAWLLAGLCAGLGLCTHYRFALVVLGSGLFLVGTRHGRARWRTAGPWLASLLVLAGLLPVLLLNLQLDWRPLDYQANGRHAHAADWVAWLRHPLEHALVMTPVAFVGLVVALVAGVRAARRGDQGRALLCCLALAPLGTYFLLSPFSDREHNYLHWPVVGYVPLLPLLPAVLRDWRARGRAGRVAAAAAPGLGLAAVLLAFVDLATGWPGMGFLHGPFEGWTELVAVARERLPAGRAPGVPAGGPALVLADNYIAAAELQFRLGEAADVYVADHPLNARHGRALQFEVWSRDEAAFRARVGELALVVMESTESKSRDRDAWEAHLRALFEDSERLPTLRSERSKRVFRFFEGRGVLPPAGG
jgi:4-amino-4-deoxy-L-arabinose transferase-like glycosyltransferase